MPPEPINAESPLEEQLVAYLDGELDGESCRRIEELLAVDPEVRRKLHRLERTWEMLDELDTAPVGEDFTRTTLEMVALAAEQDVRKSVEEAPRRRRRTWLLAGGGMFAAGLAGFMAFTLIAPNPNGELNKELIRDLPVLENLDEYRQIQDIEFLRLLQKSELFSKGNSKEETALASRPGTVGVKGDLVKYIQTLTPDQKDELLRKRERFAGSGPDEQNRLRKLHEQIQKDEHADELRGIMNRYYEWYRLLPPYSRPESTLSAEKRMDWIKDRKQKEQTEITNRPPAGKDSDTLWSWMEEYAKNHETVFIKGLPEWLQKNLSSMDPSARRRWVMWMMWQRPPGGQSKESLFSESDLAELQAKFTLETQKLLEAKPPAEQIRIVQNWAHNLMRQKNPRRGPGAGDPVNDKLLAEFFEKDLTDEQRDRLMILPSEDMQQQLLRLYIAKNRPPDMFRRGPDGFGPPPPLGEGFGPDQRPPERPENPENPAKKP
jgi:hypothetical protein